MSQGPLANSSTTFITGTLRVFPLHRRLLSNFFMLRHILMPSNDSSRPAIDSGTTVLLDRYWWSTWAYGMDEGIDRRLLAKIIDVEKVYWGDLTPDMVFLLVPPRPYSDEISIAKYNRLSRLYRTIVQETRLPVNVMDQSMTREESAEHVAAQLAALARTERS